ncbi:MAG: hypothetical protein J6D00_06215 [Christensenellaceae bacterium]|nr:hypothetical protein [Christensenellaceae bacterium]MBR3842042.1 hypothetical protein [Christensenellaceae bacterium]
MIIFRKRLLLDNDPQELARVKQILDKNGIKYDVSTTVSENANTRRFNQAAAVHMARGYSAVSTQTYVYRLYVRIKDYDRAASLVSYKKK